MATINPDQRVLTPGNTYDAWVYSRSPRYCNEVRYLGPCSTNEAGQQIHRVQLGAFIFRATQSVADGGRIVFSFDKVYDRLAVA